ncbi:MAG TPA: beta-ketoacyl-ACP synthase III [Egibacteraceae bacterium]|nr:beta-ketoacyl-ACP synthase III [Egibacteraceae bacterium]
MTATGSPPEARRAVIAGLGIAVPPTVVTNHDLAARIDTSDEWVRSRTGISERRIAEPGLATVDLAVEAGAEALKSAGGGEIDAVVLATMTADRTCPASAPEVAARLGLSGTAAFDVNSACSGFVYALASASGLIAAGIFDRLLVIGADTMSRVVDPTDRGTAVLFGDGAGAIVLRNARPGDIGQVGPFDFGSDGERSDLLAIAGGGSRQPATAESVAAGAHYLKMDGKEVYRQAVSRMTDSSRRVLDAAGIGIDDVDWLVPHQANARIMTAVADRLGIPPERCVSNVARYGNTTGASIPLALAEGDLRPGQRILLTSFGAGLSWGSALLVWPELNAP